MSIHNNQRSTRIGQTTIGENRDLRIDRRVDGRFELLEVIFAQTDVPTKPMYNSRLILNRAGLARLCDLIGRVFEEGLVDGSEHMPIDDSDYMTRGQQ